MILFPPCKINLGLHVISRREDGYHDLETLMFQLPFYDILEVVKQNEFSLQTSGIEIKGDPENNLCFKAFKLLKHDFKLSPVAIHLHKNIPMGAGLGGGSADGTYTLLALNELFELNLSADALRKYALELGSDCPLFVDNFPQLAKGRGEILEKFPVNLSGFYIHLIHPGIHVSTKDAFENLKPNPGAESLSEILNLPLESWKSTLKNDFEDTVFQKYPELRELKEKIYENGAIYASMSGSGSTIFGIYKEKPNKLFEDSSQKVLEKIVRVK